MTLGRRALEQRVVSQDLELFIAKAAAAEAGGHALIARSGRLVQELRVDCDLSKEELMAVVQVALQKLA